MIIVFGSNVLDLFFPTDELPAEGTARFFECHEEAPGGKGANQAVAAKRAGAEVRFFGCLGKGGHGRQMARNLKKNKIDTTGIKFVNMPSGLATIFVNHDTGDHRVIVSRGANDQATADLIPDGFLNKGTTVLVQGELKMAETESLIKRARALGARVVMNLAPPTEISEDALRNVNVMVLNEYEANILAGRTGFQSTDKKLLAAQFNEKFGFTAVITMGPKGAYACDGKDMWHVPSLPVKAVDTIGAGDAFVGYLTARLDAGYDLADSLRYASVAGSLTCTKIGAQNALPKLEKIEKVLPKLGQVNHLEMPSVANNDTPARKLANGR